MKKTPASERVVVVVVVLVVVVVVVVTFVAAVIFLRSFGSHPVFSNVCFLFYLLSLFTLIGSV